MSRSIQWVTIIAKVIFILTVVSSDSWGSQKSRWYWGILQLYITVELLITIVKELIEISLEFQVEGWIYIAAFGMSMPSKTFCLNLIL